MTNYEIAYSYKHAVNKVEQIQILADLTLSDADTIIQILKDEGVLDDKDMKHRICARCGREFRAAYLKGVPVCPKCKDASYEIAQLEYQLKLNIAKVSTKLREIGKIAEKNVRIRNNIEKLKESFK